MDVAAEVPICSQDIFQRCTHALRGHWYSCPHREPPSVLPLQHPRVVLPQLTCNIPTGSQVLILLLMFTSNRCMGLHPSQVSSCPWTLQILAEALSPILVLAPWTCAAISTELGSFQMLLSSWEFANELHTHSGLNSLGKTNTQRCFQLLACKPRALWPTISLWALPPSSPSPYDLQSLFDVEGAVTLCITPGENANTEKNQHVTWRVLPW